MSKRIVVIGGGVIGLFTAYYAAEAGHQVTLLERGGPDHDGCSLGNAGMIVPSHLIPLAAPGATLTGLRMMLRRDSPFGIRPRLSRDLLDWAVKFWQCSTTAHVERSAPLLLQLNLASRAAYLELARSSIDPFGLTDSGLLMLCRTERGLEEEAALLQLARRLGLPAELLSPEETARIEPGTRMDVAGSVYFPQDCYLNPPLLLAALVREVQKRGVTIRWNTAVCEWKAGAAGIESALTTAGELNADDYVIAAGAWTSQVLRAGGLPAAVRLPMQAGKGYSITAPAPPRRPAICAILSEARVAVTPVGPGLRFGGTLEVCGNDLSINARRVEGMIRAIPSYLPDFRPGDFYGLPVWSGLRPCSPDGLPYIGRFARFPNLVAATGHAMMGVSLAPVTGRIVSGILSDQPPAFDLSLLSPDRFRTTGQSR